MHRLSGWLLAGLLGVGLLGLPAAFGDGDGDPDAQEEECAVCGEDPCVCPCPGAGEHDYSDWGSATQNPTASVRIDAPSARPAKIKIGTTQGFSATGSFDPKITVPGNWSYGGTVKDETTWTWNGADGNGSSASRKFASKGDFPVSVTYKRSVKREYTASRTCQRCGHTDTAPRTVTAEKSATDSLTVKVYTLKLEIKPQSGGSWGGSAAIGAGGVGSAPHRADVRAKLDPEDSGVSFPFAVAWKPKDGDWGAPWSISANGGVVHTITSGNVIGDGGTLGGREEGAASSVSVTYAAAFDPSATLEAKADGSLKGSVGVKHGPTGLDGHAIQMVPVSVTVQRWDDAEKELVTETRTENLPASIASTTGSNGLADLVHPRPGERILSASFRVYDNTVLRKVTPPPAP